jgi:hypothetical protein
MLDTLKIGLTSDVLLTSNALILTATAHADNAPAPVKLAALEQAVSFGALPMSELIKAYGDASFTAADKRQALDRAAQGGGADLNALLYQMVTGASDAASRANYLKADLDLARRQGQYALTAQALLAAERSIEPSLDLLDDAGEIVRALLMAGATDRAYDWYQTIRQSANGDNLKATGVLIDIWPLFPLAQRDTGVPYTDQILDLWWRAEADKTPDEKMARGRLLFSLLESLDYTVPEKFWIDVIDQPLRVNETTPALPVWRSGLRAAAQHHLGETVAATLVGLGNNGLGITSVSAISSIIGQFREVGLSPEADRIAIETAILQGL